MPRNVALGTAVETRVQSQSSRSFRSAIRLLRTPLWVAALLTGAKSFADNPILGSRRLNAAGLHRERVRLAHALAWWRRARLAGNIPAEWREQFDRDGFIVVRDLLPAADFEALRSQLFAAELDCRTHQQGDTITRRVPIGTDLRARFPILARLLDSPRWRGALAYVATTRERPLYYLQTIAGGVAEGPPDPQLELHSDTFHPSLKAWLFLTDVADDGRPLTYVAGSHRADAKRLAWEKARSIGVLDDGDRVSQRGSFRIAPNDLATLGLPQPTRFAVPANTLVIADTYGLHARGDSHHPTLRVELWAFARRSPFLPWIGASPLSLGPIAHRRMDWIGWANDWLDRRGWLKQHWRVAGRRRLDDPETPRSPT